ncbi:glycosyltransferase family 39 protein [Vibrio sp. 10N.286.46.A8]|uniref:glycosyltransferase family 39 protein n=1 Tax=Vibrio sp. 10N.286.46.A8 TaxID=3229697 RepID=UPI00354B2143
MSIEKKYILHEKRKLTIYVMLISLSYIALTFINVFTNYELREFMGVDENSIIGSIHALFESPIYDMNGAYHSRVYGWTYFALNFLAIAPLKIMGLDSEVAVNLTVKFVHFLIGYALVLSFFKLARKIVSLTPALFSTLFLIATPVTHYYILVIHPESLGSLLFIWGILFLNKIGGSEYKFRYYLMALVFFTLSSLCKQVFFLISFPCLAYFWWMQINQKSKSKWSDYIVLKKGSVRYFLILTLLIPILVLFMIHPHFILDFQQSIEYQLRPLSHSKGDLSASSLLWLEQFALHPLFYVHSILLISIPFKLKGKFNQEFKYSIITVTALTLLFCFMQKIMPKAIYLFPLYPIYILNIAYFMFGVAWSKRIVIINYIIASVFFIPQLAVAFSESYYSVFSKFYYSKNDTSYLAYQSISKIPNDMSILYMPTVPMPSTHRDSACHIWRNCNTTKHLKKISPELLYINWEYEYFDKEKYEEFVKSEGYILDDEINPTDRKNIKVEFNCQATRLSTIISPLSVPRRIEYCLELLYYSVDVYKNDLFVGSPISIYRKN